jgi:hypothetical protein
MLIKTSATQRRVDRPTTLGLHPAVAERLRAFGIDPEERAREVALAAGRRTSRPRLPLATRMGTARPGARSPLELSLDPNDVRVTPLLNQVALAYEDNQYLADIVAPVQLVGEKAAKYKIWDRGPFRSLLDSKIGPNGSAKEVSATLSEDNYSTVKRALKAFANNDTQLANPTINARAAAVEQVMELHLVQREYDVSLLFNTTGSYASGNVLALGATRKWNAGSAMTPVADMLGQMELIPGDVTHTIISDVVWHTVQQNTALAAILASQLDNKGLLRPMDFGLYFGIPNVMINKADYRDDTGARKRIWSEANLWMGSINPGRDRRTFARTFRLNQGAGGWVTKTWRDEDRGVGGGDWVRTAYEEDRKIVSSDYGALITGVKQ